MENRKTQKEFRAVESLLTNTKNLCDSLLNNSQTLELTYFEVKQEKVQVSNSNIDNIEDSDFLSFIKNDLSDLLEQERYDLLEIWKWLDILETAEERLMKNDNEEYLVAATFCKNEIYELNTLIDQLVINVHKDKIPNQKDVEQILFRKKRVQSILSVVSIARSLQNNYLVDFPYKNPEFKRTIDMIITLFTYPEFYNKNYFDQVSERVAKISKPIKELENANTN
jgi:hypothetical protein